MFNKIYLNNLTIYIIHKGYFLSPHIIIMLFYFLINNLFVVLLIVVIIVAVYWIKSQLTDIQEFVNIRWNNIFNKLSKLEKNNRLLQF